MKIHFDEIEFDPTCQVYTVTASYNGSPFTGIAWFTDEQHDTYYEWSYKNGNAYGRWFGIYKPSGKLINEEFYENGDHHGIFRDWFIDGKPETESVYERDILLSTKRWNQNEILIKQFDKLNNIDSEYYDNGAVYYSTDFSVPEGGFTKVYFDEEGNWLMKNVGKDKSLRGGYSDVFNTGILFQVAGSLNSAFHQNTINRFIWYLRRTDEIAAVEFCMALLQHTDDTFKAEAIIRLGELKAVKAIHMLEAFADNTTLPHSSDRYGARQLSNIYTLSELAARSLRNIRA